MANREIFRKVAIERLSSPEQLDQLMRVTSPKGWIALIAVIGLLIIALVWGFLGYIPTNASGQGILLRRGGVSSVIATGSGQIAEILVHVGDRVTRGQVVARLRQEGIERQIRDNEARREALQRELDTLEQFTRDQTRLSQANAEQRRTNLERSIATLGRQLELQKEKLEVQRELLADGLVTQQTVLTSEQEVNRSRDQLAAQRLELAGLELQRLEQEQQLLQQLETRRAAMRELELELNEKRAALQESAEIVSADEGRVIELRVDAGDVVSPGTTVLSMEVVSEDLMAVIFVPAEMGKQVEPGMEARVTPTTVKPEEYGFIIGEVQWVAEFPSTSRGMSRLLENDDLVLTLMQQGPPIQVDVRLEDDPRTPSGFHWSSSEGPPLEISSGTLAAGSVVVRQNRPISLVIPTVRKKLGI
ncbi:MAG: NHLP bacteriocin system secretion protein [Acidobacteriota bacterium]